MNSDFRMNMRNMLRESYKHRESPETKCAICGKENGKFAFHVIEFAIYEQNRIVDGSYPICELCAPPCKKCGIPTINEKVKTFYEKLKTENSNEIVKWGVGICTEHKTFLGITF